MKVVEDLKKDIITPLVETLVSSDSTLDTDCSNSYVDFAGFVHAHDTKVIPKEKEIFYSVRTMAEFITKN